MSADVREPSRLASHDGKPYNFAFRAKILIEFVKLGST